MIWYRNKTLKIVNHIQIDVVDHILASDKQVHIDVVLVDLGLVQGDNTVVVDDVVDHELASDEQVEIDLVQGDFQFLVKDPSSKPVSQ